MDNTSILTLQRKEEEHVAGWHVLDNGQRLFSLEATQPDPPFFCYKVVDINCTQDRIIEVLNSARREPRASLFYQNRKYETLVEDKFMFGGYNDGDVSLKDYRNVRVSKWWDKLFKKATNS